MRPFIVLVLILGFLNGCILTKEHTQNNFDDYNLIVTVTQAESATYFDYFVESKSNPTISKISNVPILIQIIEFEKGVSTVTTHHVTSAKKAQEIRHKKKECLDQLALEAFIGGRKVLKKTVYSTCVGEFCPERLPCVPTDMTNRIDNCTLCD